MISAILLAAGESRRMGEFKQLLMFPGRTCVACCADHLLASRVDELVVRPRLRETDARQGLRQVIHAHAADVLHVEVVTDAVLTDFDYPEDYQRLALHKKP